MLKKLGAYAKPYSKWIALGVLCSAAEAIFELLIPLVMADIVNIGIGTADQALFLHPVQNTVGSGGPHPQVFHHIPLGSGVAMTAEIQQRMGLGGSHVIPG